MAVPNRPLAQNKYTEQYIENTSYDEDFGIAAREMLYYDQTANALVRAVPPNALQLKPWDYVSVAYPDSVTEVYTFKTGGGSGTTTDTVTLSYTDATKASLSSVAKT